MRSREKPARLTSIVGRRHARIAGTVRDFFSADIGARIPKSGDQHVAADGDAVVRRFDPLSGNRCISVKGAVVVRDRSGRKRHLVELSRSFFDAWYDTLTE